jgi:hypothetical protein
MFEFALRGKPQVRATFGGQHAVCFVLDAGYQNTTLVCIVSIVPVHRVRYALGVSHLGFAIEYHQVSRGVSFMHVRSNGDCCI